MKMNAYFSSIVVFSIILIVNQVTSKTVRAVTSKSVRSVNNNSSIQKHEIQVPAATNLTAEPEFANGIMQNITTLLLTRDDRPVIHLSEETKKKFMDAGLKCMFMTGTTFADKGPSESKSKKFLFCVFKLIGYSDAKGNINKQKLLSLFPEQYKAKLKEVMDNCEEDLNVNLPEEKVHGFKTCLQDKSPVAFTLDPPQMPSGR